MAARFLRIAVLWFAACVMLGAWMGATHQFGDRQVHVHGNLLGWASCALFALVHRAWPRLAGHWCARAHFWLHNIGLPVFLAGLMWMMRGWPVAEPLLALGSVMLVAATALFATAVWQVTSPSSVVDPSVDAHLLGSGGRL